MYFAFAGHFSRSNDVTLTSSKGVSSEFRNDEVLIHLLCLQNVSVGPQGQRACLLLFISPVFYCRPRPEDHCFSMGDDWPNGHLGATPSAMLEPSCTSLWAPTGKYSGILSADCETTGKLQSPQWGYLHCYESGHPPAPRTSPTGNAPGPAWFWAAQQILNHPDSRCAPESALGDANRVTRTLFQHVCVCP